MSQKRLFQLIQGHLVCFHFLCLLTRKACARCRQPTQFFTFLVSEIPSPFNANNTYSPALFKLLSKADSTKKNVSSSVVAAALYWNEWMESKNPESSTL